MKELELVIEEANAQANERLAKPASELSETLAGVADILDAISWHLAKSTGEAAVP